VLLKRTTIPEDGNYTETCGRKLIVKYVIYRIVHLLVLLEIVNQITIHGMNNMKAYL